MVNEATSRSMLVCSALLFVLAAMFYLLSQGEPPPKERLATAGGTLRYVEGVYRRANLASVRFGLETDGRNFQYHSKLGRQDLVYEALSRAERSEVTLWFDASRSNSPMFDGRSFHTVYALNVDGVTVRSYESVLDSWRADNKVGNWAAYGSAIGAGVFVGIYFWKRRYVPKPVT